VNHPAESFAMRDPRTQTDRDREYLSGLQRYFPRSLGTDVDKLRTFSKYVPRQDLSILLAKNDVFRQVIDVHGAIIECGVYLGGGLMTWAQLSAIYEPYNHNRRVLGFDTFTGFSDVGANDSSGTENPQAHVGGLSAPAYEDLQECIRLYDLNRPLGHVTRVNLVQGDATLTIPGYVQDNRHLVVALLYLDFDVYEATKVAIETFLPRMPKGAVIAFDELNQSAWPGETLAAMDAVGLRNLRIRRFPYTPSICYAVLD